MAAHPIVVVGDGIIEIPTYLQQDPRFQKGAKLELVPVEPATQSFGQPPKGDWRRLRGMFKDLDVNLNDELNKDRLAENAADDRMLNGNSSTR